MKVKEAPSFNAVGNKSKRKSKTKKKDNQAKKIINQNFAELAKQYLPKVILDGPTLETTKTLIRAGHSARLIHIPNCSRPDYNAIKRIHPNTYFISMETFLNNQKKSKCKSGGIYLDYMCTLEGTDYCEPRKDLGIIFNNKLLAYGAPLFITLSNPRHTKNGSPFMWQDVGKLINYINLLSQSNGYVLEILDVGGPYKNGGQMYTYGFVVHKK